MFKEIFRSYVDYFDVSYGSPTHIWSSISILTDFFLVCCKFSEQCFKSGLVACLSLLCGQVVKKYCVYSLRCDIFFISNKYFRNTWTHDKNDFSINSALKSDIRIGKYSEDILGSNHIFIFLKKHFKINENN